MTFEKRVALERAFRLGVGPRDSTQAGSWLINTGSGGSGPGGGTVIQPAPPVSIDSSAEVIPRSNGKVELDVFWVKGAGATAANFTGCAVYVEDPDISTGKIAPLDGTTPLDATAQTGGAWQPVFANNSTKSPAVVVLDAGVADRQVRIYLAAFGPHTQALLVRATDPKPTPSVVIDVPGPDAGNSGQEYAFLVTLPDDAVKVSTDYNRPDPNYSLLLSYTPPDPSIPIPPNQEAFGACRIFYVPADADDKNPLYAQRSDSGIDMPIASNAGFKTPVYNPSPQGGSFRVYFCSEDIDGHTNSLVAGVTPYKLAIVPPITPGKPVAPAPDVGEFTISGQKIIWPPNGAFVAEAVFTWSLPVDPRFAGVILYLVNVVGTVAPITQFPVALTSQLPNGDGSIIYDTAAVPPGNEVWTIACISIDPDGNPADDPKHLSHSPVVTWNIGPPGPNSPGGGQEWAPFVTLGGATVASTEATSSDGIRMVSFQIGTWTDPVSTDPAVINKFDHVDIAMVVNNDTNHPTYWTVPGNNTTFTTPQIPSPGPGGFGVPVGIDFYFLSVDPQGNRNQLVGTTPKLHISYTPTEGNIIPTRSNTDWFDVTQFQWDTSGDFHGHAFSASIVQVGSKLIVGGAPSASFGGQQNGQIAVEDSGGNLVGWIGTQQSGQGDSSSIYGGWFGQLWVGGTSPKNAPIWIDSHGIITVGGIAQGSGSYPFISVRDQSGIEKGRIGAQLILPTFPGSGDATGNNPPAGLTAGAWFTQLAIGGKDLTNWHILVTPDSNPANPYGSNVQMRFINLLQIDYPQNYNTAVGQNYEYRFDLGTSVWMAGGLAPGATYVFPGIHLYEVDTPNQPSTATQNNFGATFINRGLVLRGHKNQSFPVLVNLVTYNGDSTGSETTTNFYGQLVMKSPFAPYNNTVFISSGSDQTNATPSLYPFIKLFDGSNPSHFLCAMDQNGVTSVPGFRIQNYNGPQGNLVIDANGNWVGVPISGSTGSQTPWTQNINAAGFALSGAGAITASSILATGGSVGGSTLALTPSTSAAPAINVTFTNPSASSNFLVVAGVPFCTWNGTWSGNGVQTSSDVFAGRFGVTSGHIGASITSDGNSGGTGIAFTLTDTNNTLHTLYIRGGVLCTT